MPRYLTPEGQETTAEDPDRLIWFTASHCGYWTDDWDKVLQDSAGVHCCPHCGTGGRTAVSKDWYDDAKWIEQRHPRYCEFMELHKEKCEFFRGLKDPSMKRFMNRYAAWLQSKNENVS